MNLLAVTGQRFVGRVVDDLLHDVQGVLGAGIHTRALAHRLQPLQNADRRFGVTWCGQVIPNICGKKPTFYGQVHIRRGSRWDAHALTSREFGTMNIVTAAGPFCRPGDAATSYTKPANPVVNDSGML
ncbi:Uncharacterised protein [Bordetella pertussis]|nr:Uncharacterised protein [Bordetella pertussis]